MQDAWYSGPRGFYGEDSTGLLTGASLEDAYYFWDPLAALVFGDRSIGEFETASLVMPATPRRNASSRRTLYLILHTHASYRRVGDVCYAATERFVVGLVGL